MATVKDLIAQGKETLALASVTAQLDTEVLLALVLDKNRTWLKTWPDATPSLGQITDFFQLIERRAQGEPVAYIVGEQSFWTFDLKVTSATLIPRPETELLVEKVLELESSESQMSVLDLGTGSGAIALAIATERPTWRVYACDQSNAALDVAISNQQQLDLNVQFKHSDWFSAFDKQAFDIIVANPPYIETQDPHLSQGDIRFEPMSALTSGEDGLDDIRHIAGEAMKHLNAGGLLMFEHGYNQGEAVRDILNREGFVAIQTCLDLSGHERMTFGYSEKTKC